MNFNNPLERFKKLFNKNEQVKEKTSEALSPEKLENLKEQGMRIARKGVMYFMMSMPLISQASGPGSDLKMSKNEKSKSEFSIDVDGTMRDHQRDTKGNITEVDGLTQFFAPFQAELGYHTDYVNTLDQKIPFTYSRNFENAKAQTPAERDSIKENIIQEVQKQFARNMNFIGIPNSGTTEEVYAFKHGVNETPYHKMENATIDSIVITGLASPEAGDKNSLLPGNIDAKNVNLAEKRAHDLEPYIKEALARLGVDTNTIKSIKAEEVQFSESELTTLLELSNKACYTENGDGMDNLYAMIRAYNRGEIKDTSLVKQLDEIIATKRGVNVEVHYHGTESTKAVIPLPIGLLILGLGALGLAKLIRSIKTPDKPIVPILEPEEPRQIFSEASFQKGKIEKGDQNFHDLYRSAIETEGATEKDKKIISETVFAEEIYEFIDNPESIANGLDYKKLVEMARYFRTNPNPEYRHDAEIKEILAEEVLLQWQTYDRNIRGGIKTTDLKDLKEEYPKTIAVDYRHDPKKVLWAIEAAQHLFDMGGTTTKEELRAFMLKRLDDIENERSDRGNSRYRTSDSVGYQEPFNGLDGIEFKKAEPKLTITSSEATSEKKVAKKAVAKKVTTTPVPKKAVAKKVPTKKFVVSSPTAVKTTPVVTSKVEIKKAAPVKPEDPYYMYDKETDEILRTGWGLDEAPTNLPLEEEVKLSPKKKQLQNQIDAIDIQLRALEKELEIQSTQFGSPKASTEQKFNELEQQKRGIQGELEKTK